MSKSTNTGGAINGDTARPSPMLIRDKRTWHFGWTVTLVIAGLAFLQWSSLKELYYQVSGTQFPESTIEWHHDFNIAKNSAQEEDKPILVVFGASWCPPCRTMKREVWPDPQVTKAVENDFIPLYIDVDDRHQSEIVASYQIQGIPAVLIVDSLGKTVRRANSMSRSETLRFLTLASTVKN